MGFDHSGNKTYASYFGGDDIDLPRKLFLAGNYYYVTGATQAYFVDIPLWQPSPLSYFQDESFPIPAYFSTSGFISKFGIDFNPVAIEPIDEKLPFQIFPNPNSGTFYLASKTGINEESIYKIFSMDGRIITSGTISQKLNLISLPNSFHGICILELECGRGKYFTKILVL